MANNIPMSFDIDKDDYETFIKDLREKVKRSISHLIPVLMPQSEPLSWLDIRLISGNCSIVLKIEQRNLYVRGYSTNGGTDFWEFLESPDQPPLIPGSQSLLYSGSYVKGNGVQRRANVRRTELPLGYSPLQDAIKNLAVIRNPDKEQQQSARYLLTIIQMTAEAARIKLIAEHIVQMWFTPQPITSRMERLENAWCTFSGIVQRADIVHWNNRTPLPNVSNESVANVWTVGQASRAFGILLYHPPVARADIQSASNTSHMRTLVSIEDVLVNDIGGKENGELYGTVVVRDCWGDHSVYDRGSDNYESKGPGDYASLTGPSTAISGEDPFIIRVSLCIAKGEIVWDPRYQDTSHDTNLTERVSGKHGNVSVGYSVIKEALSATVKVVLINGDEESQAKVYGTIKASRVLGGSSKTRMLFDKSKDEYVEVSEQQPIPLTRPVFPVPLDSDLTIAVDLWDHDRVSPDDQIALGSVHFTPEYGTKEQIITGQGRSAVQVSITCE